MLRQYFIKLIFPLIVLYSTILFPLQHACCAVYKVGPGEKYERIAHVPLDTLEPGDVVRIHYRKEPYRQKFVLRRSGTKEQPIVIMGIPHKGRLPVIDGSLALQFQEERWPQSSRWLIKVGDADAADYIHIENLHLCNANSSQKFIRAEHVLEYRDNAAGVFVWRGRHIVISGCRIHACGHGVQTNYGPDVSHVTLTGCIIYDNGNFRNPESGQEHNVYLCGTRTTLQFCRFGASHSGHNIKERGVNTIIRYNWIEGNKNRQLDLVDYKGYGRANAYVYGNVIVQGKTVDNHNMIYWGGDTGHSRSGTLFLFNNTIIGRSGRTRFVDVSYSDCNVQIKNNVFDGSGRLWNNRGSLRGSNNWFSSRIDIPSHLHLGLKGERGGFYGNLMMPYIPEPGSFLIDNGTNEVPKPVRYEPKRYGGGLPRPCDGHMDIGAFEFTKPRVRGSTR